MMASNDEFMICSGCGELKDVEKRSMPKDEWNEWICTKCAGTNYSQEFIRWIEDRISPSTHDDPTGNFVLRELVQNADDVEANLVVIVFRVDGLYIYNNGKGFRPSVDGGPGDFERISSVLAKSKEDDPFSSGNFGSGFQTVYKFTNKPEVHSHGSSFRYDPTVPEKRPLYGKDQIVSPYINHPLKKGSVFRLPWRTDENHIVERGGKIYFESDFPWEHWDSDKMYELFNEFKGYIHDAILCCQHIRKIRIVWEIGQRRKGYQAERDFQLDFIEYNGKIGTIIEGSGKGGFLPREWSYSKKDIFKYFIGSEFVRDSNRRQPNLCYIQKNKSGKSSVKRVFSSSKLKRVMNKKGYVNFIQTNKSIKKSDIHILIPMFKWKKRGLGRRKAWSYSVIPLPKPSGNYFTFTAHLFPKQTREAFETHKEKAKKEWLELVLISAVRLYLKTFESYIQKVQFRGDIENDEKQEIILDYLPEPNISEWVNVTLDDSTMESRINEGIFGEIFSKKILLFEDEWWCPFNYNPEGEDTFVDVVPFPREHTDERWLLEKMGYVTFSDAFLNHARFMELKMFHQRLKKEITITDEQFASYYIDFFERCKVDDNVYLKIEDNGPGLDFEFIDRLIGHCIGTNRLAAMREISMIPNLDGALCSKDFLIKEPDGRFSVFREIIPKNLYPHSDFEMKVKEHIRIIQEPCHLLEGIKENVHLIEANPQILKLAYVWINQSPMKLPEDHQNYPLLLDDKGKIRKASDVRWVPTDHYVLLRSFLEKHKERTDLVCNDVFKDFSETIIGVFRAKILDYFTLCADLKDTIEKEKDSDLNLRIILGVLKCIDVDKSLIDSAKELTFIPVDGILCLPSDTCFGRSGMKDVDVFIGSIDGPVQGLLKEDDKKVLKGLGCGDIYEDNVDWTTRRIDRFYQSKKNEFGLCDIDTKTHKIISSCLGFIIDEIELSTDICSRNFIPVTYRSTITLSRPTNWPGIEATIRGENYHRDWPWPKLDSDFQELVHPSIFDSIRFITLSDDHSEIEKKLLKKLSTYPLMTKEKGRVVPTNFMRHFIAPSPKKEESLFRDKPFFKFLNNSDMDDYGINEVKKNLLFFLKEYYNTKPSETYSTKEQPCLYDGDFKWHKPADFALKMETDLGIIGTYSLHDDFNDWDQNILINLGVLDRLKFETISNTLNSILKEPKSKQSDIRLYEILRIILEKNIGDKEAWAGFSHKWVPVKGSARLLLRETLLPTVFVKDCIGEFQSDDMIDDSFIEEGKQIEWNMVDDEFIKDMGFRVNPNSKEQIQAWAYYQSNKREPPTNLFDNLEKLFDDWRGLRESDFKSISRIKYYFDGDWHDPKKVVTNKIEEIPSVLRGQYHFTDKHGRILNWLWGGSDGEQFATISIKDAIWALEETSDEEYPELWQYVVERRTDIQSEHKDLFSSKQLYLFKGKRCSPEKIVIAPRHGVRLDVEGWIGEWLSVKKDDFRGEIDCLINLGAKEPVEILSDDILSIDLLMNIISDGPDKNINLWNDFLLIIKHLIENNIIPDEGKTFVPIQKKKGIVFRRPKEVLFKDQQGIWELFKDNFEFDFFEVPPAMIESFDKENLMRWYLECGVRNIENILTTKDEPKIDDAEVEKEKTERFKGILNSLISAVEQEFEDEDIEKIFFKLEPLQESYIYSCETIIRKYELDMSSITKGENVIKKIISDYYFDRRIGVVFLWKRIVNPYEVLKRMIEKDFSPLFQDIYGYRYWQETIDKAFIIESDSIDVVPYRPQSIDFNDNLSVLNEWWEGKKTEINQSSFPILAGDFWWPALDLGYVESIDLRQKKIADNLLRDKRLLFNVLSMSTLLSANVSRQQIRNYIRNLEDINLSFNEIFDFEEDEVLEKMIDDTLYRKDSEQIEKIYPSLRRRMFDILILRRALKDSEISSDLISILKEQMKEGISPEDFLRRGVSGFAVKPFMRGFSGMFTGQIYFFVRECVRLGIADNWASIAFHAPSQVKRLIQNLGGPSILEHRDLWREELARSMIKLISNHRALANDYDIPFFIYYDEMCRGCDGYNMSDKCKMGCRQKW